MSRFKAAIILLLTALTMIPACSGRGSDSGSIAPESLGEPRDQSAQAEQSNHYLWGYFSGTFDPSTNRVELAPLRESLGHWNILTYLEQGPCTDCVKIPKITPSENQTFLVDLEIKHPMTILDWTCFDTRGILMFNGTHSFPSSGLTASDRLKGESELLNADGFTTLYNFGTAGKGQGGIEGYQQGKLASLSNPSAKLNGFKLYNTSGAQNTRNAFYGGGAKVTQTYQIAVPSGQLRFGYAVDACYTNPTKTPVVNPMTDFPSGANCPEPWKLAVSDTPIGQGLTNLGGQTKIQVKVYDRQGKDSHALPMIECPELWSGPVTAAYLSQGSDPQLYSIYEVTVSNTKHATGGTYKCLVGVQDDLDVSSPAWLDLTAYHLYTLTVSGTTDLNHQLWYFTMPNLLSSSELSQSIATVQQAATAGYTKVVLSDFRLGEIDLQSQTYITRLQSFVNAATAVGVEVIPALVPIGYSGPILCHDANLIEGQPVRDCLFQASGTTANVVQNAATVVANGNFETHTGNSFPSWVQLDGMGTETFADTSIRHGGSCSMRFENFKHSPSGNCRIRQDVTVEPWHCYAITFWIKTDNVVPVAELNVKVYNNTGTKRFEYLTPSISKTQDWKKYYIIFNSQSYSTASIFIGIWGGQAGGRFWVDDVTIENTGLINLIRRGGTPLVVTNQAGSVVYQEGTDFDYVSDPLMGHVGGGTGGYDLYHARPVIKLKTGSKIKNGDRILVDYYHAVFTHDMQAAACLEEEAVFNIFNSTLTKINQTIHPKTVLLNIDELRVANWCNLCQSTGKTPAQQLADATQRIDQMANAINPQWQLMVWSDMYDPYHNAVSSYYLANGSMSGAASGLPTDWIIANWNKTVAGTITFFEGRGNTQVLCGFYDEAGTNYTIDDWLNMTKQHQGIYAVMYTTWRQDFSKLAAWAQVVKNWDAVN